MNFDDKNKAVKDMQNGIEYLKNSIKENNKKLEKKEKEYHKKKITKHLFNIVVYPAVVTFFTALTVYGFTESLGLITLLAAYGGTAGLSYLLSSYSFRELNDKFEIEKRKSAEKNLELEEDIKGYQDQLSKFISLNFNKDENITPEKVAAIYDAYDNGNNLHVATALKSEEQSLSDPSSVRAELELQKQLLELQKEEQEKEVPKVDNTANMSDYEILMEYVKNNEDLFNGEEQSLPKSR